MSRQGRRTAAPAERRRGPWALVGLVVVAWLVVAAVTGPLAGRLGEVQTDDAAAFLPASAESTTAARLEKRFGDTDTTPAIVVLTRPEGLTAADRDWIASMIGRLREVERVRRVTGPVRSEDGEAVELILGLSGDTTQLSDAVASIRGRLARGRPSGLAAHVTGPAGFTADLSDAFAGIDGVLLLVALAVVLLILLVVYRSPVLPFLVLLSALFALALATGVVYVLADHGILTLNGQSRGILSILVIGAATDYGLLLTARFREELREHEGRRSAIRVAWRQSLAPIAASGGTVILALLCLLISNLNSTRSLGPVAALGIAAALLSALTFLPAVLALLGRAGFWPARPHFGSAHPEQSGIWARRARRIERRPRRMWVGSAIVLVVLAAFAATFQADGVSRSDTFREPVDAVAGQQALARHFAAGQGSPAIIIGPAEARSELVHTARSVRGVATARALGPRGRPVGAGQPAATDGGLVQVQAVLSAAPESDAALTTITRLRHAEHAAVPRAKVGGPTAIALDTRNTAERDRSVVIPLVLAVVLVLLTLLLRAIVAGLALLASVLLSYFATLGVSALVFNHLLGFPGADPSVPLFGFVFLVALGVDYNIFLMTRAREESARHGSPEGVLRGLVVTGGVITSAGIVLAATFSALVVIPLLFLAEIAFIVAFGVLLDTLVVRSVLVPAVATDLGSKLWWPGHPHRDRRSP